MNFRTPNRRYRLGTRLPWKGRGVRDLRSSDILGHFVAGQSFGSLGFVDRRQRVRARSPLRRTNRYAPASSTTTSRMPTM